MRYELEIFRHYVADNASICMAHCPENLQAMFDQFKITCGADRERLAIVGDVEAVAQNFAGMQVATTAAGFNLHDLVKNVEPPATTPVRTDVRRRRKPNLDKLIAKAKAAGATSVIVDGVEMKFGEPGAAPPSDTPDVPRYVL
jgi:hypothetical protein